MTATQTEKPARQSRAARAAAKAKADQPATPEQPTDPQAADDQQPEQSPAAETPEQPTDAAEQTATPEPDAKPEPAPKAKEPTATDKRIAVFTALCRAAGNLLDSFDLESDDDGAAVECHELCMSKEEVRAILSHRLSYCGNTGQIWDTRLGPVPTGRGKIPATS